MDILESLKNKFKRAAIKVRKDMLGLPFERTLSPEQLKFVGDATRAFLVPPVSTSLSDSKYLEAVLRVAIKGKNIAAVTSMIEAGFEIDSSYEEITRMAAGDAAIAKVLVDSLNNASAYDQALALLYQTQLFQDIEVQAKRTTKKATFIETLGQLKTALTKEVAHVNVFSREDKHKVQEMVCWLGSDLVRAAYAQAGDVQTSLDPQKILGTALLSAVAVDNMPVLEILLEHDADPNGSLINGATVLHAAASAGKFEIVKFLIRKGANVHALDAKGRTVLQATIEDCRVSTMQVVEVLLESGADPTVLCGERKLLDIARSRSGERKLDEAVVEALDKWNKVSGMLYVHALVLNDDSLLRSDLIKLPSRALKQEICLRAQGLYEELFKCLVDDRWFDLRKPELDTMLEKIKHPTFKAALTKAGVPEDYFASLLPRVAARGEEDAVKFLLEEAGFDIDAKDRAGYTALGQAAMNGRSSLVSYLLEKGADPYSLDADNYPPLFLAVRVGSIETMKTFRSKGVHWKQPVEGTGPNIVRVMGHEGEALRLLSIWIKEDDEQQGATLRSAIVALPGNFDPDATDEVSSAARLIPRPAIV